MAKHHKATVSPKLLAKKATEAPPLRLEDNAEGTAVLAVLDRIAATRKEKKK